MFTASSYNGTMFVSTETPSSLKRSVITLVGSIRDVKASVHEFRENILYLEYLVNMLKNTVTSLRRSLDKLRKVVFDIRKEMREKTRKGGECSDESINSVKKTVYFLIFTIQDLKRTSVVLHDLIEDLRAAMKTLQDEFVQLRLTLNDLKHFKGNIVHLKKKIEERGKLGSVYTLIGLGYQIGGPIRMWDRHSTL